MEIENTLYSSSDFLKGHSTACIQQRDFHKWKWKTITSFYCRPLTPTPKLILEVVFPPRNSIWEAILAEARRRNRKILLCKWKSLSSTEISGQSKPTAVSNQMRLKINMKNTSFPAAPTQLSLTSLPFLPFYQKQESGGLFYIKQIHFTLPQIVNTAWRGNLLWLLKTPPLPELHLWVQ